MVTDVTLTSAWIDLFLTLRAPFANELVPSSEYRFVGMGYNFVGQNGKLHWGYRSLATGLQCVMNVTIRLLMIADEPKDFEVKFTGYLFDRSTHTNPWLKSEYDMLLIRLEMTDEDRASITRSVQEVAFDLILHDHEYQTQAPSGAEA